MSSWHIIRFKLNYWYDSDPDISRYLVFFGDNNIYHVGFDVWRDPYYDVPILEISMWWRTDSDKTTDRHFFHLSSLSLRWDPRKGRVKKLCIIQLKHPTELSHVPILASFRERICAFMVSQQPLIWSQPTTAMPVCLNLIIITTILEAWLWYSKVKSDFV